MPDVYLWTRHVLIHMHMFACAPFYFEEMLILVYSLMDSDERASLKKTMFWIKQRLSILHEHVVQCFTCNACCILQVLCIQKKKYQWDLFRVTFPFKHVVGGREAHKIVGVEFSFFYGSSISGRVDYWERLWGISDCNSDSPSFLDCKGFVLG